jgi:nitroreductase
MSEILATIKQRRSIRRFTDQALSQETLDQLFEAVRWSPSWANTQCWELVLIQNPALQESLSRLVSKKNPATLAVAKAPAVLAFCANRTKAGYYNGAQVTKFPDWFMFDLGLATENLCLAAESLGLGTVIVGAFDHDETAALLEVPQGYEVVVLVPVGYPDQAPTSPKRRSMDEFVHHGRFGAPDPRSIP